MDPSISLWIVWLGFTSLNRWFRCCCTTEGSASPSFVTHRQQALQDWVLEFRGWGPGSVCSKAGHDLFILVWVLSVYCASPCSHTAKISSSCKFCDFFYFFLGPREILILNPFSNIKFLVRVKKKSYPSFLIEHLTLCYKYRLKNETKKQSAFVHARTTDGNWLHKTSHSQIFSPLFHKEGKKRFVSWFLFGKTFTVACMSRWEYTSLEKAVGPQKTPFVIWSK